MSLLAGSVEAVQVAQVRRLLAEIRCEVLNLLVGEALGLCRHQRVLAVAVPMTLTGTQALAKASSAEASMIGTWTGHREGLASTYGYRNGPATLTVTEASASRSPAR